MESSHTTVAHALQRLGWILIPTGGLELSRCPRRHLSGPPIGVTRLLSPQFGFVADVQGYTAVFWHAANGSPGKGRVQTFNELCDVLNKGDEELAKHLAKTCG